MSINVEITETQIIVTAENGTRVYLSKKTGVIAPTNSGSSSSISMRRTRTRGVTEPAALDRVKVSPRWWLKVGDIVTAQHKKGTRKFRTTVRAFKVEHGETYALVTDPRTGGTHLMALDRLTRVSAKAMAS